MRIEDSIASTGKNLYQIHAKLCLAMIYMHFPEKEAYLLP